MSLGLQRLRLVLWGETMGLIPAHGPTVSKHNRALHDRNFRSGIESSLNQLKLLLTKADIVTDRYALNDAEAHGTYTNQLRTSSHGMTIFRDSFERFKSRIRQNQKQKSIWTVTRWAVHDYERFEKLVDQITKVLDALESITSAIGMLERQRSMLIEEIASLSDTESLNLLQQVGSAPNAHPALRDISDTASVRLTIVTGSSRSYFTAPMERLSLIDEALPHVKAPHSTEQILSGQTNNSISQQAPPHSNKTPVRALASSSKAPEDVPQQKRWIAALLERGIIPEIPKLQFSEKDERYGSMLRETKGEDDETCRASSAKLASQAHENVPLARRVFLELRNIRRANIPYISAVTVEDQLDKILASIEGPPGTPYEGGVFWITVHMTESQPPLLHFHTKIYHPNIDSYGKLCADYASWWWDSNAINQPEGLASKRSRPWFSESITNHYSLGALLVAICALLASPNIDDPLVPEIAEKYCTDYQGYCDAARLYTQRYACSKRPETAELKFSKPEAPLNMRDTRVDFKSKNYSESVAGIASIAESPVVWQEISDDHLDPDDLSTLLKIWFPPVEYGILVIDLSIAHTYKIAPPRPLTNVEIEEINKCREAPHDQLGKYDEAFIINHEPSQPESFIKAAQEGDYYRLEKLLSRGTVGFIAHTDGTTPFFAASAYAGNLLIIQLILEGFSRSAELQDNAGRTPLFLSAMVGHDAAILPLLERHPAALHTSDKYGTTPLIAAVRNGHTSTAELLLERHPEALTFRDGFGLSLFWWARQSGEVALERTLQKYAIKEHVQVSDDFRRSGVRTGNHVKNEMWCKLCTRSVHLMPRYSVCPKCDGGFFRICIDCKHSGLRCLGGHTPETWIMEDNRRWVFD
ncbi:Ubiquitin-conjugating enzyme [Paramyrothecium foliicola]|nr:Ubiquitin-conjugating enzyme [Paramyrothecium foliicola]